MRAIDLRSSLRSSARERLRLLVVESGCSALPSAQSDDFDETLTIPQLPGESPAAFAERALRRIAAIERSGRRFRSAAVLTGHEHDEASHAARRLVVQALALHARAHPGMTEVVVSADASAGQRARQALRRLVEERLAAEAGDPLPVRLSFQERPASLEPESGVYWSPPKPP